MKNMYAVKCLYQSKFYDADIKLLDEVMPAWEERIILIKASCMEEADMKCERAAKEYESDYVNVYNQVVKVRLYDVIDVFAVFDTDDVANVEVYSKLFTATEKDVVKMLNIEYPIEE